MNIIAVGCWNHKGCIENTGLSSVITSIKQHQTEYNHLILLGDNYYPDKLNMGDVKIKKVNINEMLNGFKCFDDISINKKVILGNHDVEEAFTHCSILKNQLKIPGFDVKFPYGYEFINIGNSGIVMIYVDTSLYDSDILKNPLNCYANILHIDPDKLQMQQNLFIQNTIKSFCSNSMLNITQIILFGHEPLITTKPLKTNTIPQLLTLLFDSLTSYPSIKISWICADYHVYQYSTIRHKTHEIDQYIFGTGGAKLDEVCDMQMHVIDTNFALDVKATKRSYGYGKIAINATDISHEFIECPVKQSGAAIHDFFDGSQQYVNFANILHDI